MSDICSCNNPIHASHGWADVTNCPLEVSSYATSDERIAVFDKNEKMRRDFEDYVASRRDYCMRCGKPFSHTHVPQSAVPILDGEDRIIGYKSR